MPEKLSHGPRANSDLNRCAGLSRGPNLQKKLTAAAWSNTFPAPGATLDLDFANNRGFVRGVGQGGSMQAVTFTRASVGKYIDGTGTLVDAANNVPRFDWASTESTGAGTAANPYVIPIKANPACNGLLIEESRANHLLWCRDATQTNWTKTNVTAAKDQTGIDGVANAASSLTASADGGTCIQTITLASGSRTGSVYLKRLTGTGNIQVSLDGSTWSTVDLSNGLWNRIVISGTVTNPTVGIKIATNDDAVAMDYGQVENNSGTYVGVTSPILTTTASVTRSADVASMTGANFSSWYQPDKGTINIVAEYSNAGYVASISDNSIYNRIQTGSNFVITTGGALQASISLSGAPTKVVFAYTVNYAELLSGSLSAIDTSVILPLVNRMYIGTSASGNTNFTNGTIKRITYFPKVLTKNAMQNLNGYTT